MLINEFVIEDDFSEEKKEELIHLFNEKSDTAFIGIEASIGDDCLVFIRHFRSILDVFANCKKILNAFVLSARKEEEYYVFKMNIKFFDKEPILNTPFITEERIIK